MIAPLRIGFVTGATPDKWARSWRDQRREPLELVPVTEPEKLDGVRDGSLVCLAAFGAGFTWAAALLRW